MLGLGFAIWACAFVVLYSMLSVGCRFAWDEIELVRGISLQRAQLVLILVLHLAAAFAVIVRLRRANGERLLQGGGYMAALAAFAAIAFTFAPTFVLSSCV